MFRLYDTATGQAGPVRPARPGELRIWVAGQVASPVLEAAELRAGLVADLVRRVAERHHLRVTAWHQAPDAGGRRTRSGRRHCARPGTR